MKEKLKATAILLKEGTPLVIIIGGLIAVLTIPAVMICKYVSIIWGVFF